MRYFSKGISFICFGYFLNSAHIIVSEQFLSSKFWNITLDFTLLRNVSIFPQIVTNTFCLLEAGYFRSNTQI